MYTVSGDSAPAAAQELHVAVRALGYPHLEAVHTVGVRVDRLGVVEDNHLCCAQCWGGKYVV